MYVYVCVCVYVYNVYIYLCIVYIQDLKLFIGSACGAVTNLILCVSYTSVCVYVLQCVAVCCSVLQCAAGCVAVCYVSHIRVCVYMF